MFTKRLNKLTSLLPKCGTLADVGCDHGYVGIYALQSGIADMVYFIDVSRPSLDKARANCPINLRDRAEFICRDGIADVRCDCAVIAGMGSMEVISILQGAQFLPRQLVLQPMRNQPDLRRFLSANYRIVIDQKVRDGKFYDFIVAEACDGGQLLTDEQAEYGCTNLAAPTDDFIDFLQNERRKYADILTACADTACDYVELRGKLCRTDKVLQQSLNILRCGATGAATVNFTSKEQ